MTKEFNVLGWCNPESHYMADISGKVEQTLKMIYKGNYFIINRPRQYGKTTLLEMLDRNLRASQEWLVFNISFEGIGSNIFKEEKLFCQVFANLLTQQLTDWGNEDLAKFLIAEEKKITNLQDLSQTITKLDQKTAKKLVLLIDEVDKSSNNQLFLDFLGMLRAKYLKRHLKSQSTFHSVILTGVHDIKTLKLKLRSDENAKRNSPWNIAADYKVDMNLQAFEIIPMLEEYARDRNVKIEADQLASHIFHFTSGYPFLVSSLCKIIDEDILPDKSEKNLDKKDVEEAAKRLIQTTNSNFDSLKKNLQNNPDLYDLVYDLIVNGQSFPFNIHDPVVELGIVYGVFKKDNAVGRPLQIQNRIYAEIIYDFMSLKMLRSIRTDEYMFQGNYILDGNRLNMEKVLLKFQAFMKEQYRKEDRAFLEHNGRLIFLAFLKPILNGVGFAFKETQISEEKRLDIAISFFQYQYIVELKIWRGKAAHKKGLDQLAGYLEKQNLETGYLIIFDHRLNKSWDREWSKEKGKRIFVVWV